MIRRNLTARQTETKSLTCLTGEHRIQTCQGSFRSAKYEQNSRVVQGGSIYTCAYIPTQLGQKHTAPSTAHSISRVSRIACRDNRRCARLMVHQAFTRKTTRCLDATAALGYCSIPTVADLRCATATTTKPYVPAAAVPSHRESALTTLSALVSAVHTLLGSAPIASASKPGAFLAAHWCRLFSWGCVLSVAETFRRRDCDGGGRCLSPGGFWH